MPAMWDSIERNLPAAERWQGPPAVHVFTGGCPVFVALCLLTA